MTKASVPSPVRNLYNRIRHFLPRDYGEFNGVRAKGVRRLDVEREFPEYEAELCAVIDNQLELGMSVQEVGGGMGVSAVHICRTIGEGGSLTVYEGSHENAALVADTLEENDAPCEATLRNAVVGTPLHLYTKPKEADAVSPGDLPDCDALVMDCEGTEIQILAGYPHTPDVIVVETHDQLVPGCTAAVKCLLREKGYEIVERQRQTEDISILAAKPT